MEDRQTRRGEVSIIAESHGKGNVQKSLHKQKAEAFLKPWERR